MRKEQKACAKAEEATKLRKRETENRNQVPE